MSKPGALGNWGPFHFAMFGCGAAAPREGVKNNRTLRRKLDIELPALEDCYLMLRDLKSDGALAGQSIPTILQYDDAVESIAAAMQHLRNVIDILGKSK